MAAAGETAAYGLSGVRPASRIPQKETQVNGCTFLEIPSIIDTVWESTWARRAWTLQEGLLSTRCLVFADRGVLYRCRDLYIEESLQQLVPNNTPVAMDNHDWYTEWNLQRLFVIEEGDHQGNIDYLKRRIAQYTQRQLSFPHDSLNAFLGVFTDFEQSNISTVSASPIHIWGVPLDDWGSLLEWYHPIPPKERRHDFPTWSWSGWEGGIEFANDYLSTRFISRMDTYDPVVYQHPGMLAKSHDHGTKCLYLTGPIVRLKFASPLEFASQQKNIDNMVKGMPSNREGRVSHQHSVFELFPGTFSIIRSFMSTGINAEDQTFGLLLFVRTSMAVKSDRNPNYLKHIIVLKKGSRSYSRVGYLSVEDVWNCKHINTKGASVDKKIFPRSGLLDFGQDIVRQRICLE